jgi:hypothetical protein
LTDLLSAPIAATTKSSSSRWAPERRLEFIDFRLLWDGTINRSELVDFFGISIQQASYDLAKYAELAPSNLSYDKSAKTYRAAAGFKPLLAHSNSQYFLTQLADLTTGEVPPSSLYMGWRPPCDVVRYPTRPVQTPTLLRVLWAIRDRQDLRIVYQSMRRASATDRWIAPHALASDGFRWHVRAWCHEHEDFRDFVLSRVQRVVAARQSAVDSAADESWHTRINVIVRPRIELSEGQRSAIEVDFGMTRGRLVLNCRKALAFYVLRQLQLDRPTDASVIEQPLELENRATLSELISVARKVPENETASIESPKEL